MDHGFYEHAATNIRRARVVDFTRSADAQWSGVVELRAGQPFAIHAGLRTDIFVSEGALVDNSGASIQVGGFLSLYDECALNGAVEGAVLLVYREPAVAPGLPVSVLSHERLWLKGSGMDVAHLVAAHHHVALIQWAPQTYVQPHSNSGGEELFVLSGELRVNGHDLPAGSWLRLGAGERHDSGAARATLILLRSGHLQ